jgi:ABC-2 type transport system permease protein
MRECTNLLHPRVLTYKNRLIESFRKSRLRLLSKALLGIGFWAAVFLLFQKVLLFFRTMEPSGDLLNSGLLAVMLLTFFFTLFLSSLLSSFSTFFLSEDLSLILSRPVSLLRLYCARLVETIGYSSWIVLLFAVPFLGAYGCVYGASAGYYLALPAALVPFFVIPSAIGALLTMVLVNFLRAGRIRNIFILLPIFSAIGLYLLLRFQRPEHAGNLFSLSGLAQYIRLWLDISSQPFLPSFWVFESLMPLLKNTSGNTGFFLGILWITAGATVIIGSRVSQAIFFRSWSKYQESRRVVLNRTPFFAHLLKIISRPLPLQIQALAIKDFRIFFRDTIQWSQLFLLAILVALYLHSFSVLKFNEGPNFFLQNLVSFVSMGVVGFVAAAISVRFAFLAVSQEGFSFWVIRSSPILLETFLWNKFWTSLIPLLLLSEGMILSSNWLVRAPRFMMILSSLTLFFMMFGIVGLAVGIGAIYPRFKLENPARLAIGLSGTLFLVVGMFFVVGVLLLEIWPVYTILAAEYRNQPLSLFQWGGIILSFCGAALFIGVALFLPMRLGLKNLTEMDF